MQTYIGIKIIKAEPIKLIQAELRLGRIIESKNEDGYFIVYPDGYESWSPKQVFEEAYRPIDDMTFGLAIEAMKKGFKVARRGWNYKGIFIELDTPHGYSPMVINPYVFIDTTGVETDNSDVLRGRTPWFPSQIDMLAEDWVVVDGSDKNE